VQPDTWSLEQFKRSLSLARLVSTVLGTTWQLIVWQKTILSACNTGQRPVTHHTSPSHRIGWLYHTPLLGIRRTVFPSAMVSTKTLWSGSNFQPADHLLAQHTSPVVLTNCPWQFVKVSSFFSGSFLKKYTHSLVYGHQFTRHYRKSDTFTIGLSSRDYLDLILRGSCQMKLKQILKELQEILMICICWCQIRAWHYHFISLSPPHSNPRSRTMCCKECSQYSVRHSPRLTLREEGVLPKEN
jgi:hypothetical protein